jgi:hypothetical protein
VRPIRLHRRESSDAGERTRTSKGLEPTGS